MEWKELYSNGQNTGIIAEHKKIHEQRCFILLKKKKSGLNIQIRNKFEDYSSISPRLDGVHDYKRETKH